MSSISFERGFFMDTLWNHPENEALRGRRASPFVLEEGDLVFVPDLRPKDVDIPTGRRHVFRRKGVPEWLRVRFVNADDSPRAGVPYTLRIEPGIVKTGSTDGDGWLKQMIPPNAMHGVVELPGGERYEVSLGRLSPADTVRGMQQRLHNLGYPCGDDAAGDLGPGTWNAIRKLVLEATGKPFEGGAEALPDIQERLRTRHGS